MSTIPYLVETHELFGCNTADVFIMSVSSSDNNAVCQQWDEDHGITFPTISADEGGGDDISNTYGITASPTYILIAPDHTIVEQDMWPISSAQTFVDFFEAHGIEQASCEVVLAADFTADNTQLCDEGTVTFSDHSTGEVTSWNWTFEGGNPATSTEQNPVVTYEDLGSYDVILEVSDGTDTHATTVEDYISISETPVVALDPFENICINWPAVELAGGTPEGGVYSGPGVTDGIFDPVVAGAGTHTIVYTYTSTEGCEAQSEQDIFVDECIGIDKFGAQSISVYPNPTKGNIDLNINTIGDFTVQVYNVTGIMVFEANGNSNGVNPNSFNLSHLNSGVYFISTTVGDEKNITKLNILEH